MITLKKYDNKSRLLFTDTDCAIYEIKTENFYADFSSNKEMKAKSKYHDDSIKLVIRLKPKMLQLKNVLY